MHIPQYRSEPGIIEDAPNDLRTTLAEATSILLHPDSFPGQRLEAIGTMAGLLGELAGIDVNSTAPEDTPAILLAGGTAVAPTIAARCLLDLERTTTFLHAMERGIRAMRRRYPGEIIEVLYAGCGPYATLAVPLLSQFSPDEVRFTLLDAHERSLAAARRVIERLGYAEFVRDYITCDAAVYRHPDGSPIHLAVTEVMQNALEKEPQFAVTANLAPQLADGGIFIPQRITVEFCLADMHCSFAPLRSDQGGMQEIVRERGPRIVLARLIELSAETVGALAASAVADPSTGIGWLPAMVAAIPDLPEEALGYSPILRTTIALTDSIVLQEYASGLTLPKVLADLGHIRGGESIEFRYRLGAAPGFMYRRIGEPSDDGLSPNDRPAVATASDAHGMGG